MKEPLPLHVIFTIVIIQILCSQAKSALQDRSVSLSHEYQGCADLLDDDFYALVTSETPPTYSTEPNSWDCAITCFQENYGPYSTPDPPIGTCYCFDQKPDADKLIHHEFCDSSCPFEGFDKCSSHNNYSPVYKTVEVEETATPLILVMGGQRLLDSEVIPVGESADTSGYDCTDIAEAPVATKNLVAMSYDGMPMICGGAKWGTDAKSCHIYNNTDNMWHEGPKLTWHRIQATVARTHDGVYWVLGGCWGPYAEWLDPESGKFVEGPEMPFLSTKSPCAATNSNGKIFFLGTDSSNKAKNTKLFEFDPNSDEGFVLVEEMPARSDRITCQNFDMGPEYGDLFVVVGGRNKMVSRNIYVYSTKNEGWEVFKNAAPDDLSSTVSVLVPGTNEDGQDMMVTVGGNEKVFRITIADLEIVNDKVTFNVNVEELTKLVKKRLFPLALLSDYENVCRKKDI